MSEFITRAANAADAASIARIYNEGIDDGLATFETEPRSAADIEGWLAAGFPLVVVETGSGEPVAWASAPPYRPARPKRRSAAPPRPNTAAGSAWPPRSAGRRRTGRNGRPPAGCCR